MTEKRFKIEVSPVGVVNLGTFARVVEAAHKLATAWERLDPQIKSEVDPSLAHAIRTVASAVWPD